MIRHHWTRSAVPYFIRAAMALVALAFVMPLVGCAALGTAAYKLGPPPKIAAAYKGLAGQSVAVMVWTDRGLRLDYPGVQTDIARSLQQKLELAQTVGKSKELKGTTFPVRPESIVKYQHDYPQVEGMQLVDVAPKMGVQRLIYIEVTEFATRPEPTIELYRGSIGATIKVAEVGPDKKAKIGYTDSEVRAGFPKKAPQEGVPNAGDYKIYRGTIDALTTEIVHRFVEWESDWMDM